MKAFDLHKLKLTQKEDVLEQKCSTGSSALAYPNLNFRTCGIVKALTSSTIFKKCGIQIRLGRLDRYIPRINLGLLYNQSCLVIVKWHVNITVLETNN